VHLNHRLGVIATLRGDVEEARRRAEECLARARAGGFRLLQAEALGNLAWVAEQEGDFEEAFDLTLQDLAISREIGFTWFVARDLIELADYSLRLGRIEDAESYAAEALELGERMDDRLLILLSLTLLAHVSRMRGDIERAGRWLGAVQQEAAEAALGRGRDHLDQLLARAIDEPDAALHAAVEVGQRLSIAQAIEEARTVHSG
jgi:tetratricopeptide (TPR) repeat protein